MLNSSRAAGARPPPRHCPATHRRHRSRRIDQLVTKTLADTGVPSASIAIVRDGRIVLTKAYGKANEGLPATPALPYQIASNSKQFTAMALLLLEDEGKLSLDDPVAKYVPGITQGDRITIRQLLSHTSGLQDFWPQDYMFADMSHADRAAGHRRQMGEEALGLRARRPLPVQQHRLCRRRDDRRESQRRAAADLLGRRIFTPLGMHPVDQDDTNTPAFPAGYHRYALGPVRVAQPPARGWLYAAGELSMTAEDLAKWDIARIDPRADPGRRLGGAGNPGHPHRRPDQRLRPRHRQPLRPRAPRHRSWRRSRRLPHPERHLSGTKAAIIVFTNADFSGATDTLTEGLEKIVLDCPRAALTGESDRLADSDRL